MLCCAIFLIVRFAVSAVGLRVRPFGLRFFDRVASGRLPVWFAASDVLIYYRSVITRIIVHDLEVKLT